MKDDKNYSLNLIKHILFLKNPNDVQLIDSVFKKTIVFIILSSESFEILTKLHLS